MKKNTFNKLKKYALGAAATMIGGNADSAIFYTDIADVDMAAATGSYDIDIDGDGVQDFTVNRVVGSYDAVGLANNASNSILMSSGPYTTFFGSALGSGANISSAAGTWASPTSSAFYNLGYSFSGTFSMGGFVNQGNQYVGVRFDISGDTHYGWIQVNFAAGGNFSILDYAYEQCADQPILAGATTGGATCAPPTEECSSATTVACSNTYTGSTTGGTVIGETTCGTATGTMGANWHTFVGDGNLWTFSTDNASTDFDTKMWLYSGACGALTCVDGDDDGASDVFAANSSELSVTTTNGVTYYIVVGGYAANEGNYGLDVSCTTSSTPSECVSAISATSTACTVNYTGSTVGNTTSTETGTCGTTAATGGAIWYTFTGDGNNWTASTVNPGTNFDTKLWVYDGVCGALACVDGNDDDVGTQSTVDFPTTNGTDYFVVVGGYNTSEGDYELSLHPTLGSFTSDPSNFIGCDGENADFYSTFTGLADSTAWQLSTDAGVNWINLGFGTQDSVSGSVDPSIDGFLIRNTAYSCGSIFDSSASASFTVNSPTTSTITTSSCGDYTSPSGQIYTTSNTYMDTITNGVGCDSVITINLTVNPIATATDVVASCGDYVWRDGMTYSSDNSTATYTESGVAAGGCDSIYTLNLTVNPTATATDVVSSCGDYVWRDGMTYSSDNSTATYTESGVAAGGCDSIYTLNLTVNPIATATDVVSSCGDYVWRDGMTYSSDNSTATYTESGVAAGGCDSIYTLNLTVNPIATATDVVASCGDYVWRDGMTYSSDNSTATYTESGVAAGGCDSIYTLNLTVNPNQSATDVVSSCASYVWRDGMTYSSSNSTATYTEVGVAAGGCDSVYTLNFTLNPAATATDVIVSCGDYVWRDGMTYSSDTSTATYNETGVAAGGCDSVYTLNLTINPNQTATDVIVSCGDYVWRDGMTYSSDNSTATYTESGVAAGGCDSVYTLDLTVNQANATTQTVVSCGNYTWAANGSTYSVGGTYVANLMNSANCDSTVTLDLTIDTYAQATIDVEGCGSVTVFGNTYTSSTTVSDTILLGSSQGCDTITVANVIVNNSTVTDQTIVTCTSYTWPANSMSYTTSGTHTVTLTGSNNCDSVVNLDLTIGSFAQANLDLDGCDEVTVFGNTYTSSQVVYDTIIDGAGAGCDSITMANITVNESSTSTLDETINFDESYLFDGTELTTSGTYTATAMNEAGCDSNITLNLTVQPDVDGFADLANGLKVYPNPTNHMITLEADVKLETVRVVDTKGSVLISRNVKAFKENIDLSNIDSGIYFYEIIDEEGNISRGKIIKED